MQRPRRDIQVPLRYRLISPPRFSQTSNEPKRRRIDPTKIDRNDPDQALAVIAPAPECSDEPPTFIPTELPHFKANYVAKRSGYPSYPNLSELDLFKLFFCDSVIEILSEQTNLYAETQLSKPPLSLHETRH
jgi:hypothetical protein